MTDAWRNPAIKKLNLSIRIEKYHPDRTVAAEGEWLFVEHGGRTMKLRVQKCHGGAAYLEIDAPMDFRFTRESAKDQQAKPRTGVAR